MPRKPLGRLTTDTSNRDIMNAVRKLASSDYQRFVPPATKANLQTTISSLVDSTPGRNEFMDVLLNRIGTVEVRNQNWENPLGKFKRQMLTYGNTIEEVQLGLAQAYTYDPDRDYLERMIFGQHRVEAQTSLHKINRQEFFPVTVNEDMLRRAFLEEGGLSSLVTGVLASATNADQLNEFLTVTRLFKEYAEAEGFFDVNVGDVAAADSTEATAKAFLRQVRAWADKLAFISPLYNASGMPTFAERSKLELIVSPEVNAAIDVNALAAAFNIERAEVPMRVTVIPAEQFDMAGTQAILTTSDFFVIADTLFENRSAENPVGLNRNYYLHHHQIISASRFVPAIRFTTGAGTVIEIVDTPVTGLEAITVENRDGEVVEEITRGERHQVLGSAITTPTGGLNDAVRLELVGAQSTYSYVTQTGVLLVSDMDAASEVTIVATSTDDPEFTESVTLPVVGDLLTLWPDPSVSDAPTPPPAPEPDPEP